MLRVFILSVSAWATTALPVAVTPALAAPAFSSNAVASPNGVAPGGIASITASVTSGDAANVVVEVEVDDPNGRQVADQAWDSQAYGANEARDFPLSWQAPDEPVAGLYSVRVSVYGPVGRSPLYLSNAQAGQFSVGAEFGNHFSTVAVGSVLPSETTCANRVRPSPLEPRRENYAANHAVPDDAFVPGFTAREGGVDDRARALADRVSGNFTGTTDELIQWGACKWGIDESIVRDMAWTESSWRQSGHGDYTTRQDLCDRSGQVAPCYQSWGLMQVKPDASTLPAARDSTAFNVDLALLEYRVCYEGWAKWLYDLGYGSYQAGDVWGCAGVHYSGTWYGTPTGDDAATTQSYLDTLRAHLADRSWQALGIQLGAAS